VSVYTENGYSSRADYLLCLSEDYGVPLDTVKALADVLGPMRTLTDLLSL
jgi:hypothetical protein